MKKLIQHAGQDQGEYDIKDIKAVTKPGEEAEK
jgi:hypothetical protein